MGKETKIDWCNSTWSPITGCLHDCEYCYARKIARRFAGGVDHGKTETNGKIYVLNQPSMELSDGKRKIAPYPHSFAPTFHRYRLGIPEEWKDPRVIFVCSMADMFGDWVPDSWIAEVFRACEKARRHIYVFLTKNPERYIRLAEAGLLPKHRNFWYGTTADRARKPFFYAEGYNTFCSIEPILEDVVRNENESECFVDWVIVGAETGRRKGRVVPEREWITHIAEMCKKSNTPLFMKESLRELMGEDFIQQTPWSMEVDDD